MGRGLEKDVVLSGFRVPRSELVLSFARSSGAGGQNVNKVNSKAEIRWDIASSGSVPQDVLGRFLSRYKNRLDADGLVMVTSEKHRDRERNIEDAVAKLEEWVQSVWEKPKPRIKTKPTKGSKRRRVNEKRLAGDKKRTRAEKIRHDDWD
jgi:ribosome-associated protein